MLGAIRLRSMLLNREARADDADRRCCGPSRRSSPRSMEGLMQLPTLSRLKFDALIQKEQDAGMQSAR